MFLVLELQLEDEKVGLGWVNGQNTEEFQGSENTVFETVVMATCFYAFAQGHRMFNTKSKQ